MASCNESFCSLCDQNHITVKAVEFCPDCDEYLCGKCQTQHGRRSLIIISGVPEAEDERDTITTIRNIIENIDPEYNHNDIIRSHRVGQKGNGGVAGTRRPRQIIVRLSDPDTKFRILKCRKNLKSKPELNKIYINEDLTKTRSTIFYHARQLLLGDKISHLWTTNGKILMKDGAGTVHNVSVKDTFVKVTIELAPTYKIPDDF